MKYKSILFFISLALIASIILSTMPIEKACGQEENGCYKVQVSEYEKTFGIKNAYFGLIAFSALALITISHIKNPTKKKKQIMKLGLFGGSIFAIYFLYLQFFVINATCPYCLITDVGTILAFIIIIFKKEKPQKTLFP